MLDKGHERFYALNPLRFLIGRVLGDGQSGSASVASVKRARDPELRIQDLLIPEVWGKQAMKISGSF